MSLERLFPGSRPDDSPVRFGLEQIQQHLRAPQRTLCDGIRVEREHPVPEAVRIGDHDRTPVSMAMHRAKRRADRLSPHVDENTVGTFDSPDFSVRREKAPVLSGCESRPATVAPAGSSRSGWWRQQHRLKHSDATGRLGRLSDHTGHNASERRAGLETRTAEADPPLKRGRLPAVGKRATRAPTGSAGVLAVACVEEGIGRNTGSPAGGAAHAQPTAREGQVGPAGWRRGP